MPYTWGGVGGGGVGNSHVKSIGVLVIPFSSYKSGFGIFKGVQPREFFRDLLGY